MAAATGAGGVERYIPELRRVDAKALDWCRRRPGAREAAAHSEAAFSIQSISKVFTLTLALGPLGDRLWRAWDARTSGSPSNSHRQLETSAASRHPFINADSAIAGGAHRRDPCRASTARGDGRDFVRFMQSSRTISSIMIDEAVGPPSSAPVPQHRDRTN